MNKIIIPVAALAMGVALVGSVSSTLAWYQYSTKAQAAFIGASVGESENLEIETANYVSGDSGPKVWKSNLDSAEVNKLAGIDNNNPKNIIPITTGALNKNVPLPANFNVGVDTGVAGIDTYGNRQAAANNYVQFTLNIRYKKLSYGNNAEPDYIAKKLNLVDLTITDTAGNNGAAKDLYKAVRVHFAVGANGKMFARDSLTKLDSANEANNGRNVVTTNTYGNLDTDNDGKLDTAPVYEWEQAGAPIVYGVDGSKQYAYNAAYGDLSEELGTLPTDGTGLAVVVTIWIEGWQKLEGTPAANYDAQDIEAVEDNPDTDEDETVVGHDPEPSAMWDPAVYFNKQFKVGMRFQAVDAD